MSTRKVVVEPGEPCNNPVLKAKLKLPVKSYTMSKSLAGKTKRKFDAENFY